MASWSLANATEFVLNYVLRTKCKRDLKSLNMRSDELELLANERAKWRYTQKTEIKGKRIL